VAQTQQQFEARVERLINASPEAVFDAFTSEEAQAQWFTDPADTLVTLIVEPHVGGRWVVEFDHDGARYSWAGQFTEVDRPHRFSIEIMSVHPDGDPFPSTFTVTCEARGDQTFLTASEFHASVRRRDEAMGGLPGLVDITQQIAEQGLPLR
jgi:uncharacterized protein YndB with AHSA1/START domain